MRKITFLILNYKTYNETIQCIKSIEKLIDIDNYEIIVVDNFSEDGSGEKIKENYKDNNKIHVILNKENLGFTGGNNVGYEYARNILKTEYIVMLNSDTYLLQNDFCSQIDKEFKKSKFGILGPKIFNKNGMYQKHNGRLDAELVLKIKITKILILRIMNFFGIYPKIKDNSGNNLNYDERNEDVVLHGCCLIFSPLYLKKVNKIPNKTKFYCEEEIIYLDAKEKGLKTVYCPQVKIFHLKKAATNNINISQRKRNEFVLKNLYESNKVLLREIKRFNKEMRKNEQ